MSDRPKSFERSWRILEYLRNCCVTLSWGDIIETIMIFHHFLSAGW